MTYRPHTALSEREDIVYLTTPLPAGHAWWLPVERAIVITTGLLQRVRRSVLAHELAHVELGDSCLDDPKARARQERLADDLAAHRLIPLERLAEVLVWAPDLPTAAEELNVSDDLLQHRLDHLHPSEKAVLRCRLAELDTGV